MSACVSWVNVLHCPGDEKLGELLSLPHRTGLALNLGERLAGGNLNLCAGLWCEQGHLPAPHLPERAASCGNSTLAAAHFASRPPPPLSPLVQEPLSNPFLKKYLAFAKQRFA